MAFALAARGTHCQIANRTAARAEALAESINGWYPGFASVVGRGSEAGAFDLIVNTTSLGMQPREDEVPPLPLGVFDRRPFVYDLIYAPAKTRLLQMAENAGCETANGVGMLVQQGAISLSLWTGLRIEDIPTAVMEAAVRGSL